MAQGTRNQVDGSTSAVIGSCGLRPPVSSLAPRRGVTMLELLVVLIILLMVTAAAIPIMAPALDNRRMREAGRMASTFISGARSRAIQTGREVGVVLERFNGNPYAMNLAYVEIPPAYGGDSLNSRVQLAKWPIKNGAGVVIGTLTGIVNFPTGDSGYLNLVHYGDSVRFNYQGVDLAISAIPTTASFAQNMLGDPWYISSSTIPQRDATQDGQSVAAPYAGDPTTQPRPWFLFDVTTGLPYNAPTGYSNPVGLAFQILRQPVRTSDTPMQLPEGIVVDLMYSGVGQAGYWGNRTPFTINRPPSLPAPNWQTNPPVPFDPLVTFTPAGAVGHVRTDVMSRASGPIFLLLGRRELVPDVALIKNSSPVQPEDKNIYDSDPVLPGSQPENRYLRNFWITIGHQTGLVTVAENAAQRTGFNLVKARAIAQTAQSVGGK